MENEIILQTLSIAIFLGMLAQFIALRLKIPGIILLMGFGILAGPQVLGLLHTDQIPEVTAALISVAVAIILFEGGMTLNLADLKLAPRAIFNIIIFGPIITMVVIAVCVHYILGINWGISFLTGSILVVSGPTVIAPLLARVRIAKNLKEILTWESIIVDAVGAIIMVVVLHFIISESNTHLQTLGHFLSRVVVGVVVGYLTGKFLVYLVPRKLIIHEHLSLSILSIVIFTYWVSNHFASESGLLTATIAGLMLGQFKHPAIERIREFKEGLSTLIISILFVLLSSRIDLGNITRYGWKIILVVLAVLFVARPLMVFLTTAGTSLNLREKLFLTWIAPRGIIAAATASLFTFVLVEHHFPQAEALETIIFLIIISTVVLQGLTISPVANLLGVNALPRDGFLLVGVHPFSIAIAKHFNDVGIPVKLVDNNAEYIEEARSQELDVHECNIMDEETLEELGLERMGTMLALTDNDQTNTLVCRLGRKLLGMENAYQVVNTFMSNITDDVLLNFEGKLAFDMKLSVNTLNDKLTSGRLSVQRYDLKKAGDSYEMPENMLFPLFFIEKGRVIVAENDEKILSPDMIALQLT
ncbi:MAG: sodium:proton antiporter [Desulfuromusa sp.]|nr:sodium:proton antiporter [Desulfuromusa sp.]